MSKITPKNLSYDTSLPPFLQRMRGEFASSNDDGRHERAIARPKRARNAEDDEDDEPTYVDESTNHTLSREEYKELVKDKDAGQGEDEVGDVKAVTEGGEGISPGEKDGREKETQIREKIAAIGGAKKRKQGRVVGDEGEVNGDGDGGIALAVAKAAALAGEAGKGKEKEKDKAELKKPDGKKDKKKAKKIKLSFGDEEG